MVGNVSLKALSFNRRNAQKLSDSKSKHLSSSSSASVDKQITPSISPLSQEFIPVSSKPTNDTQNSTNASIISTDSTKTTTTTTTAATTTAGASPAILISSPLRHDPLPSPNSSTFSSPSNSISHMISTNHSLPIQINSVTSSLNTSISTSPPQSDPKQQLPSDNNTESNTFLPQSSTQNKTKEDLDSRNESTDVDNNLRSPAKATTISTKKKYSVFDLTSNEYKPNLVHSPLSEWTKFLSSLETELILPIPSVPQSNSSPVYDACILSCGCLISEQIAVSQFSIPHHSTNNDEKKINNLASSSNNSPQCPICHASNTVILKPVIPLRNLGHKIRTMKQKLGFDLLSGAPTENQSVQDKNAFSSNDRFIPYDFDEKSTNVDLLTLVSASNVDLRNSISEANKDESNVNATINKDKSHQNSAYSNPFTSNKPYLSSDRLLKSFMNNIALNLHQPLSLADTFRIAASTVFAEYPDLDRQLSTTESNYPPGYHGQLSTKSSNLHITKTSSNDYSQLLSADEISLYKLMSETISGGSRTSQSDLQKAETFYKKCFPNYRKQFQHSINSKFSFSRSKPYISTSISPNATTFVVLSEKKWSVYKIPANFNDPPLLIFTGKSTGEVSKIQDNRSVRGKTKSIVTDFLQNDFTSPEILLDSNQQSDLDNLTFKMASLSNRYLAISTTSGVLLVYDLEKNAKLIYYNKTKFDITTMTISASGQYIACATSGLNKKSSKKVPIIILHWLRLGDFCPQLVYYTNPSFDASQISKVNTVDSLKKVDSGSTSLIVNFQRAENVNIELTSNTDDIKTLTISPNDQFIACSTYRSSRVLIIQITNHHEPRLVQKLSRRSYSSSEGNNLYSFDENNGTFNAMSGDNHGVGEGITCVRFHPGSSLLTITSAAPKAYPVIIATDLQSYVNNASSRSTQPSAHSIAPNMATTISGSSKNFPGASGVSGNNHLLHNSGNTIQFSSSQSNYSSPTSGSSKLKLVMRIEKVGTMIDNAEFSPRSLTITSSKKGPLYQPPPPSTVGASASAASGIYQSPGNAVNNSGSSTSSSASSPSSISQNNSHATQQHSQLPPPSMPVQMPYHPLQKSVSASSSLSQSFSSSPSPSSFSNSPTSSFMNSSTMSHLQQQQHGSSSSYHQHSYTTTSPSYADITVAYLDKNGLVYLMHSVDKIHRRVLVLTEVAPAISSSSNDTYCQASLRFTPSGHQLFILDRKGNFYIQDFAAGYPQQAGISKCRILS